MFIGCRRGHYLKAKTSQKVTDKFAESRQKKTIKSNKSRDGFSEYKNFERELISGCCTQIYCWTYYNISMCEWKSGNFAYKTGLSFTKRESRLQNRILNYKRRILEYKWDSRFTIYHCYWAIWELSARFRKKFRELKNIIAVFNTLWYTGKVYWTPIVLILMKGYPYGDFL